MPFQSPQFPAQDAIVDQRRRPTQVLVEWVTSLMGDVDAAPARLADPIELEDQSASIGTTTIPLETLNAGLYRVTWYTRITQAATTSSSLTVTVGWTDGGVACSFAGAAITGNTVSTVQSGTTLIRLDQGASLTYQTTYASVGATPMQYRLDIVAEQISA